MKKQNWQLKTIQWFYDLSGELDEYNYKEISIFGNNMYMLFIATIVIGFFASMAMQGDILSELLFITFIYSQIKQEQLIKRLGLDKVEVLEEETKEAVRKMFGRTVKQSIVVFFFTLIVILITWKSVLINDSMVPAQIYFGIMTPIVLISFTIIAFIAYYVSNKKKIIVVGMTE